MKLPNNFFSQTANRAVAANAASPADAEMANKTLYLLEELDNVAIHATKLKEVVSMDDGRARGLYEGNQTIERIGHLMINGNSAPNLGTDEAVWNRAIYIPWEAKYIGVSDGPIDPARGIFRQDFQKAKELVDLTSAFMTVCLHAFTAFLKANPNASSFNIPQVVKDLIHAERQKINPVPVFVEKYMTKLQVGMLPNASMEILHTAFNGFCRVRYVKEPMDYATFAERLRHLSYIEMDDSNITSHILTEEGMELYQNEAKKRGFISADNMDIPNLFKRQRQN